jgi:hypothetical protein
MSNKLKAIGIGLAIACVVAIGISFNSSMFAFEDSSTKAKDIKSIDKEVRALTKPVAFKNNEKLVSQHTMALQGSETFVELLANNIPGDDSKPVKLWVGSNIGFLQAQVSFIEEGMDGTKTINMSVQGDGSANLTVTKENLLYGSVWFNGRVFEIEPVNKAGVHKVLELQNDAWDLVAHDVIRVKAEKDADLPEQEEGELKAGEFHQIDVLALYSPKVEKELMARFNGRVDASTAISNIISANNGFLANSKANARLRIANIQKLSFNAKDYSGNRGVLRSLQKGSGQFEQVAQLRAESGADIVVFFMSDKENKGKSKALSFAFRPMNEAALKAENGFAVVSVKNFGFESQVSFSRAFASLMGIAGSYHTDKAADKKPFVRAAWGHQYGPEVSYSYGKAGQFGTLMSSAKTILPYFSNPNVVVQGEATGQWQHKRDDAFAVNALNLNSIKIKLFANNSHSLSNGSSRDLQPYEPRRFIPTEDPSIPSGTTTYRPMIQKLIDKGQKFYVGPDIYAGIYRYRENTSDQQWKLNKWVQKVNEAGMNYIRLIPMSNNWNPWHTDLVGATKVRPNASLYSVTGIILI